MTKEEELTQYCSDLTCPQYSNCDLCMYRKGIDDCIKEIYRIAKSTTDVNKHLMYENIAKKLERLKEIIKDD